MKRFFVFFLVCFAVTVFAEDIHKIFLKDGRVIKADTKPMINGDRIYFERFGMMLYLPVDRVDVTKTERGGDEIIPVRTTEKKSKKKVVISDEELNEIRKRSRLANEDEIRVLEASPAGEEGETAPVEKGGTKVDNRAQQGLQGKLNDLMSQRSLAQSQVNDLMNELGSKRDQFGFASQAADKERLEGEIRDAETRLGSARSQLSSLDNQINATQQEIASTPVVIETNVAPTPPPTQEQPAE